MAAASCVAIVEVLGTVVPLEASIKVPELGFVQEFPVPLLPPEVLVTVVIFVKGVKVAKPSAVSVSGNVLVVTVPAPTPELVHILMAAASCVATVEVLGKALAPARRKVPAVGVPQAFPVPLLPPEVEVTVVTFAKGVKVAYPSTLSVSGNVLVLTVPALTPEVAVVQRLMAAASCVATVEVVGKVPAVFRMKVPALGVPQAFPVPLLPTVPVVNDNPVPPAVKVA
jgi:hypothetical protein